MDAETLAEDADRYVAWEHALANGGCVPAAAYRDACKALQRVVTAIDHLAEDGDLVLPVEHADCERAVTRLVVQGLRAALEGKGEQ